MKVAFSTGRPAHVVLPANLLTQRGLNVTVYTAAYRSRFHQLEPGVRIKWVPQLVASVQFVTGIQLPRPFQRADTAIYDSLVGMRMEDFDIFWGWATGALASGRAARRRGARFVLDRACPHVDAQQTLVRKECEQLGVRYRSEPRWFRDRQLAEYEEADTIVVPSQYSRRSFPMHLQPKVLVAPLYARLPAGLQPLVPADTTEKVTRPFTFGTVGGQPLRKGLLYLLQAWEQLQLSNARLLLRTDAPLDRFPVLRELLRRLPNVEVVGYVDDMASFYRRCDAFVFPTVDDGFGMALLEAMAQGLPSITTDRCGGAELFERGTDLLVVSGQDAHALTEAMHRLYSSAELRESLSLSALKALRRIRSEDEYSLYSQALDQVIQCVKHPIV